MRFDKYELNLNDNQGVEVTLNQKANVKLMTPSDFMNYQRGAAHRYFGGEIQVSPYVIRPNTPGSYVLTIDLGGYSGAVKYGTRIVN